MLETSAVGRFESGCCVYVVGRGLNWTHNTNNGYLIVVLGMVLIQMVCMLAQHLLSFLIVQFPYSVSSKGPVVVQWRLKFLVSHVQPNKQSVVH